jgi:hypothetical protein
MLDTRIALVIVVVLAASGCTVTDTLHEGVAVLHATRSSVERLEPTLGSIAHSAEAMTTQVSDLSSNVVLLSTAGPELAAKMGEIRQPLERVASLKTSIASVGALAAPLERVSRCDRPLEQLASFSEHAPTLFVEGLVLWMLATIAAVGLGIRLGVRLGDATRAEAPIVHDAERSARVIPMNPSRLRVA